MCAPPFPVEASGATQCGHSFVLVGRRPPHRSSSDQVLRGLFVFAAAAAIAWSTILRISSLTSDAQERTLISREDHAHSCRLAAGPHDVRPASQLSSLFAEEVA